MPERYVGEPPERFPYDRRRAHDVHAWDRVCPNFYWEGKAYSKARFVRAVDATHDTWIPVDKGEEKGPAVLEEDRDDVLELYLRWRRKYMKQGLGWIYPGYNERTLSNTRPSQMADN